MFDQRTARDLPAEYFMSAECGRSQILTSIKDQTIIDRIVTYTSVSWYFRKIARSRWRLSNERKKYLTNLRNSLSLSRQSRTRVKCKLIEKKLRMKRSCVGLEYSQTLQIYFFVYDRQQRRRSLCLLAKAKKKALESRIEEIVVRWHDGWRLESAGRLKSSPV